MRIFIFRKSDLESKWRWSTVSNLNFCKDYLRQSLENQSDFRRVLTSYKLKILFWLPEEPCHMLHVWHFWWTKVFFGRKHAVIKIQKHDLKNKIENTKKIFVIENYELVYRFDTYISCNFHAKLFLGPQL